MSYIIVARNPMNQLIVTMDNDDDEIEQFSREEVAENTAAGHPLFSAWGYQVLEVN
jgi:hypothetical protein